MDTPRVTLDEATAQALTAENGHPIPLCNPAGEVIGYYVSPRRMAEIKEAERQALRAELDRLMPSEEELERILKDPRPNVPHEEVIRWVEGR